MCTVPCAAESSGISMRHLAITPEEYKNNPNLITFGAPSLNDRVKLWEKTGMDLAVEAAEKAIAEWGNDRKAITHVVTFSTSGMLCPGIDLRLIKQLGLSPYCKHYFVSYMGCHAGLIGLRNAAEIAQADPSHRVLVVCAEVNSVNAQSPDPAHPVNNIIVDVIFGDGAAGKLLVYQNELVFRPRHPVNNIIVDVIFEDGAAGKLLVYQYELVHWRLFFHWAVIAQP